MSQTWNIPDINTIQATAVSVDIPNALNALRSLHSGAAAPPSTTPYMLFADTAKTQLLMRNAGDTAFDIFGALNQDHARERGGPAYTFLTLSATTKRIVLGPRLGGKIKQIVLYSKTASVSSSGNEWQFKAIKNGSLQLFSGTIGNFTTGPGSTGGGTEFVADTAYTITPDQNNSVVKDDQIEFEMTKVGAVTTLAELAVFVEWTFAE